MTVRDLVPQPFLQPENPFKIPSYHPSYLTTSLPPRALIHRHPLPILHLPFLLMLLPYPLQYPEIIQKVQHGRDEGAGGCYCYGDAGGDGEAAVVLRVDVCEGGD